MVDKRIRIILDSKGAKRNADELNNSVKGIGASAEKSKFSVNKLAAAIAAVISTQKIAQFADAFTRVQNQLVRTTTSTEDLARSTQILLEVANDTRAGLEPTVGLYTSLTVSTKELGIAQAEIVDITKTVNNLFLEGGKSADEAASAIRQLSQAFDKGALNGDEFVSVSENAPGILRAIQEETGKTRAELKEMSEQGELTAELLVRSLRAYSDEAQKAADKTQITLAQAYTVADNNLTVFIGKIDDATGASAILANTIVSISEAFAKTENIEAALDLLELLAVVVGTRLVVALGQSAVAFTLQQAAALRATVTMNAFGQVTARTTVLSNALALASRGAATAMAFLGGPIGILAIVAASLVYFSQKGQEAVDVTKLLSQETDNLTDAQKELVKLNINKGFEDQITIIEDASKKIKFLQDTLTRGTVTSKEGLKAANDELVVQKARLDEARIAAEKLTQKLADLVKPRAAIAPEKPTEAGAATAAKGFDAGDDLQDALDKENANIRVIESAKNVTKSLEQELALRRTIADIYRSNELDSDASFYDQQLAQIRIRESEEMAIAQARATEEKAQREERLQATLDNDKLERETKAELKAEFDAQEKTSAQILEEELTAIREEGKTAREELDRAERQARLDNAGALGDALLSLGQGQSKKIFKVGQTLALAQAAVALPTAVLESFKNGGGYPWGLIPAAAMAATGLKSIQQIRSAGSGLGGGGGGSVPAPSIGSGGGGGGSPSIPTTASAQQVEQRRVYELRGVAGNDKITVDQFRELMEQDGAVVVLSDSVNDASRRNVIGVTAR